MKKKILFISIFVLSFSLALFLSFSKKEYGLILNTCLLTDNFLESKGIAEYEVLSLFERVNIVTELSLFEYLIFKNDSYFDYVSKGEKTISRIEMGIGSSCYPETLKGEEVSP